MYKLLPVNLDLQPFVLNEPQWRALCASAGLSPSQRTYSATECQSMATALKNNPTVLPNAIPPQIMELDYFLYNCGGITVPGTSALTSP